MVSEPFSINKNSIFSLPLDEAVVKITSKVIYFGFIKPGQNYKRFNIKIIETEVKNMDNKVCTNCNEPLAPDAVFCKKCGTQTAVQNQPDVQQYPQGQQAAPPYPQGQPVVQQYPQGQPGVPQYPQGQPGVPQYPQGQPGMPPYNQGGYYNQNIYDTPQVRALINQRADKYISKFNNIQITNATSSWNWCAFLFTPWWMMYRGMTDKPLTWILAALSIIAAVTSQFNPILSGLISWVNIGFGIYVGLKGNIWYKQQIDDKLRYMTPQQ